MTLNWSDLNLNGMPAIIRALQELDQRVDAQRSQHNLLAHHVDQIYLENLKARLVATETLLSALCKRLDDVEHLISEEIMAGLARPAELREVVAELGHGWRIERQVTPPNASAAMSDPYSPGVFDPNPVATKHMMTADSYQTDGWVQQYAAAADEA